MKILRDWSDLGMTLEAGEEAFAATSSTIVAGLGPHKRRRDRETSGGVVVPIPSPAAAGFA